NAREERLQRRRQSGRRIGQQVVDLRDLAVVRVEVAALRLRGQDSVIQELAVRAPHRFDIDTAAKESYAGPLRVFRSLQCGLTMKAVGARIGDVVAGDREAGLRRVQPTHSNVEDTAGAHALVPAL